MATLVREKTGGTLIEYRDVAGLTAAARNARTHSADQIADLAASMREWGWTMPVLVAQDCDGAVNGEIIAGHGRVLAAAAIYAGGGSIRMAGGDEIPPGQVPVIVARGWSAAQRRAYVIADNQLALSAGWDESILRLELFDLREVGFDLSKLGFDDGQLAGFLDVRLEVEADPEDAPEPPVVPVSRPGDLWQLGRHRLLCGDATSPDDVARVLGGAKPHLMVTDPPYGVNYDPDWRNRATGSIGARLGGSWATSVGTVAHDARVDWSDAWMLFAGDVAYVWHAGNQAAQVAASLEKAGLVIRAQIVWVKQNFVISRGHYHSQHEPCWYLVRKGYAGHWNSDRKQSTVWEIANRSAMGGHKDDADTNHSTQKPVECMKRPIENNSAPGDAVYDPFVGSGTTIVAAEMTGRRCFAIEISPAYVDVSVMRWQNVTGLRATHEATGQTFDSVSRSHSDGPENRNYTLGIAEQQGRPRIRALPHDQGV